MRLQLFAFGKLRTAGLRETADYYLRNLRPWTELHEEELKPLHVPDKSPGHRARIQEKEGALLTERLGKTVPPRGRIYLLDETGKNMTTRHWAELARELEASGTPAAAFCIGSSLGFGEAPRARAHGLFSLGAQTLSHELARVVLLEQLYRAWSVIRGHPYHNEG